MPFMNPRMVLIGSLVIMKINKNVYFIFDDHDGNDDLLNTHGLFIMNKVLNVNNNNLRNNEEYDDEMILLILNIVL